MFYGFITHVFLSINSCSCPGEYQVSALVHPELLVEIEADALEP